MATTNAVEAPSVGLLDWLRAISRPSLLALGVGVLAVLSAVVTYAMVTGLVPYNPTPTNLVTLLLINLSLGVSLGGLIAWRLARLWSARQSGLAGAKLHVRLVAMFSVIAVVPAILVAIFATVTLNLGIEAWFSTRVQTALDNAVGVARQYMIEQGRHILYDAGEIESSIEHDRTLFDENKQVRLSLMMEKIAIMTTDRGLVGSFLIDSKGSELAKSAKLVYSAALKPSATDIADAHAGQIVVDGDPETGYIHALIYLPFLKDAYLLVVRHVDPKVFGYYHRTKVAVSEYDRLNASRSQVQLIFAALYMVVSLVILLSAIWLGLWAANRLVRPISSLIGAAERVSEGDLKAQVEVERGDDEIGLLGRAFNRMTGQLDAQRSALVSANRQNDERRRFTEAVLAGVSAGVIGLDRDGIITIVNRAAARLLGAAPEEVEGRHYSEAVPELAALIRRAISEPVGRASGEVTVKRGTTSRALSVQVSSERGADGSGFVATFDDITDLVSAQRTAAWADIARRIAHEIKNPLTPIQLSAERLKRKYAGEISTDPEVFTQCTDTIIRQVGDIGRMVDEFSSFARMPTPVMRRENAQELIQQAVFLQRVAHPQITFETRIPKDPVYLECDGRLVTQALTNVLKNAGEAVSARIAKGVDATPGRIVIALEPSDAAVIFRVTDNGVGLPHEHRDRLTEPYVTTRAKGTGLGLAIVRKVMEDHGGDIVLQDAGEDRHGAEIVLTFPPRQKKMKEKGPGDEQARIADRV
jgi:two-component system nitrogen regulation sensor histidine kinase NtrY